MGIIEQFTGAKWPEAYKNEDALFIGQRFLGVIDGVTSKTALRDENGVSGGRFAARTLCRLLETMPRISEPEAIFSYLNRQLIDAVNASFFAGAKEPPAASVILYDARFRRVISYGDCQLLLGGIRRKREKKLDRLCARKRAEILSEWIRSGRATQAELMEDDVGRKAIREDILDAFLKYANQPGEYGFPVLGIGSIVPRYVDVFPVAPGQEVILASDGYPRLCQTLAESEAELSRILREDPLLYREYPGTKGLQKGCVSYDDRTYLRFTAE